jgi:ribulose-bisphosphate carboxylase large chain
MTAETLRATYLVETPHEVEEVAERLTEELGVDPSGDPGGTVEAIRRLEPTDAPSAAVADRHPAGRFERAEVDISISLALAGPSLPNLATALLGNAFELREISGLRLLDFELPAGFEASFPGPGFGIAGTRRLAGVEGRPLIGSIIKPSVGLTPEQTGERAAALARAGIDFMKDDELLGSPPGSPLERRVAVVMQALEEVAAETGRKAMFAFNISSNDADTMRRNHDAVLAAGGSCVMVSINQVGLAAFASLRRHCELPVHGHRNGWGMLTRSAGFGIDFCAYQRIWRLAGVDQLHCNGFSNKFFESDASVARSVAACLAPTAMHGPLMPVLSSGQWGGQAPTTYHRTRTVDLLYLSGGGIQGHPGGFAAGVAAVRAAWEAAMDGEPLELKARTCEPLAQALATFGGAGNGR